MLQSINDIAEEVADYNSRSTACVLPASVYIPDGTKLYRFPIGEDYRITLDNYGEVKLTSNMPMSHSVPPSDGNYICYVSKTGILTDGYFCIKRCSGTDWTDLNLMTWEHTNPADVGTWHHFWTNIKE